MILNDFYSIESIQQKEEQLYDIVVLLNKNHEIFKGHFPGNPVTPGVCMIQIVKETAEQVLDKNLQMKTAKNIKFMEIINPEIHPKLRLELVLNPISDSEVQVSNTTYLEDKVGLKMHVNFTIK